MSNLFKGCSSLSLLPNKSKWKTKNITKMNSMFDGCISLSSLPDISQWATNKVKYIRNMFSHCVTLSYLPNLIKWNFSFLADKDYIFNNCLSLISELDISSWIIVEDEDGNKFSYLFPDNSDDCEFDRLTKNLNTLTK